ncbi:MAG: CpsD/CapB family tyrosine-protein kinase [Lachnospiraceae bacterium]|nr:CpsD/CapB family tyrosine-protein kinase [Lachnospiraceae bacterium]
MADLNQGKQPDEQAEIKCGKLSFVASEAYKLLRTNLLFTIPANGGRRVIGVTSAIRGEGKSTTSINLAYTLAETGAGVLLVDGDLRLPSIGKRMGTVGDNGLVKYLAGICDYEAAVQVSDVLDNLYILQVGIIPPNPSELLSSSKMEDLIKNLPDEIEYVVIDLPPVNIVADALTVSRITDGMLITVRQNYCDKKSFDTCVQKLRLVNAKIAGIVFNDAYEADAGHGKYKKYYKKYYRSYRYGDKNGYGDKYGYGYEKEEQPERTMV